MHNFDHDIRAKDQQRDEISQHVEEYLRRGGTIKHIPVGHVVTDLTDLDTYQWNFATKPSSKKFKPLLPKNIKHTTEPED